MEFLLFAIGMVLLIKAADFFVDASISIAKIFKIPEVIIGATIVSIGTTLPETLVSATSAFKGIGAIAYGNALGSIICNTSLISAISLIFASGLVDKKALRVPTAFFYISFFFYVFMAYRYGRFSRLTGLILIGLFICYAIIIIVTSKKNIEAHSDENEVCEHTNPIKCIIILVVSAAVIAFGANLLVDNGTIIAKRLGVPDSVIGITLVALGTSLPELSTAITAIMKGHANISIGNIIGANLFNMVLVSGIAATIAPFEVPTEKTINGMNGSFVVDIPVAFLVMSILSLIPLFKGKTYRWQGILLLVIYVTFLFYQFFM